MFIILDDGGNGGTAGDGTADWQDVAGIADDPVATLDQRISKSVNASAALTVATDNDFVSANTGARTAVSASSYLLWGHDGGSNIITQTTDLDLGTYAFKNPERVEV